MEKNWALSVDQCWLQALRFSVYLIDPAWQGRPGHHRALVVKEERQGFKDKPRVLNPIAEDPGYRKRPKEEAEITGRH